MAKNMLNYALSALGFLLVIFLLIVVTTDIEFHLPTKLILLAVFAIGPIAIMGVLGLQDQLGTPGREGAAKTGAVMLVVAFACFTMMLVVQQNVILRAADFRDGLAASEQEALPLILRTVSGVQLGMDFTFDIFIGVGMLIFSWLMLDHPYFGRFVGVVGLLAAGYLLVSNMWAFPDTPHEAGVFDPAAFAIVWWLLVIVKEELAKKRIQAAAAVAGS